MLFDIMEQQSTYERVVARGGRPERKFTRGATAMFLNLIFYVKVHSFLRLAAKKLLTAKTRKTVKNYLKRSPVKRLH